MFVSCASLENARAEDVRRQSGIVALSSRSDASQFLSNHTRLLHLRAIDPWISIELFSTRMLTMTPCTSGRSVRVITSPVSEIELLHDLMYALAMRCHSNLVPDEVKVNHLTGFILFPFMRLFLGSVLRPALLLRSSVLK